MNAGSLQCWACDHLTDDGTCLSRPGAKPSDGDIGVCLYCRAVQIFIGEGWKHRAPTIAELDELDEDPRIPIGMTVASRIAAELAR